LIWGKIVYIRGCPLTYGGRKRNGRLKEKRGRTIYRMSKTSSFFYNLKVMVSRGDDGRRGGNLSRKWPG